MPAKALMPLLALSVLATWITSAYPQSEGNVRIVIDRVNTDRHPNVAVHFRLVDEKGQPASKIPDEDVIFFENVLGVKREVGRFRPQQQKEPMATILALDTSGSMATPAADGRAKFEQAREATEKFFRKLDTGTPAGLVLFHHEVYKVLGLKANRNELQVEIRNATPTGGTAYLDATLRAIQQHAADNTAPPGRRAVVVMTDGRDSNSQATIDQVVAAAKEHGVRVITVGLGQPGRNEPVRTLLVLDRSGSMAGPKIENLRKAAIRYVELVPRDRAQCSLIAFDHEITTASAFDSGRNTLRREIQSLHPRGETHLFDAMYDGIMTLLAARGKELHREAIVVFSDGLDTGSRHDYLQTIDLARDCGIRVFTLGLGKAEAIDGTAMKGIAEKSNGKYFHLQDSSRLIDLFEDLSIQLHDDGIDENSLKRLAEETGGEYFPVRDVDKLSITFEGVATNLQHVYTWEYLSPREKLDGTSREVEIRYGTVIQQETYVTTGLFFSMASPVLYVFLLVLLGVLLAIPGVLRSLLSRTQPIPVPLSNKR
jgi:VWFA-related protein